MGSATWITRCHYAIRVCMRNRFDIFLHWLPKPNTTLLLNPGLGPAINRGGVFQTSMTYLCLWIYCSWRGPTRLCLHFRERREKLKQIAKVMREINIINKEFNVGKFSQLNRHKNLKNMNKSTIIINQSSIDNIKVIHQNHCS